MRLLPIAFFLTAVLTDQVRGQVPDSIPIPRESNANSIAKVCAVPAVLITLGVYAQNSRKYFNRIEVREWRNEYLPNFQNHSDDYLQFAPIAMVYAFDAVGVKAKNDLTNRTLLLVKSELMMIAVARVLKSTTHVMRPDGSNFHSFPSGHTCQAFVAATFLHKELGHINPWYSVTGYAMATSVAALRVLNNRHWISDVLAGAGIGILTTNIAYATHRYRWGKKSNMILMPTYSRGPGVYFSMRL